MRTIAIREHQRSGFTLLELLVVVAIIGFLSSVSIVALSASKSHSRDTQRKLDQVTILKAAELYTNDFGAPPTQLCQDNNLNDSNPCSGSGAFLDSSRIPSSNRSALSSIIPSAYAQAQGGDNLELCQCGAIGLSAACQSYCDSGGGGGGGGGGDGGGGGQVCGNDLCEGTEYLIDQPGYCEADCTCNNNGICEVVRTERLGNCADCTLGTGSGTPSTCGNPPTCDAGETFYNCNIGGVHDCSALMCQAFDGVSAGPVDTCCLSGVGCAAGALAEGYYGVCNNQSCDQKYLLQPPAFTCTTNADCNPGSSDGVTGPQDKFVSNDDPNWLAGLNAYVVRLPEDPGHHAAPQYDIYYASSNPDIVKGHRFCVWVSLERESSNFNPYNDIIDTPTGSSGAELLKWTPLCSQ